jgi:hypothetical protein
LVSSMCLFHTSAISNSIVNYGMHACIYICIMQWPFPLW